jgi:hypothetical protein
MGGSRKKTVMLNTPLALPLTTLRTLRCEAGACPPPGLVV